MKKLLLSFVLTISLIGLFTGVANATTDNNIANLKHGVVLEDTVVDDNLTLERDLFVDMGKTLTVEGELTVNGDVYLYGDLRNRGKVIVTGTINALHYGSMMSAGDYDYSYIFNNGSLNVTSLNITSSFLGTPIPEVSHSWDGGVITKEATCEANGGITYTCLECDLSYNETINALGHDFRAVEGSAKQATCTEPGKKEDQKCNRCDAEVKGDVISPNGHNYSNWVFLKEATCTADGLREKECSNCGNKVTEGIPALGHAWSSEPTVDKAATCIEDGLRSIHCSRCNETKDAEVISAIGHSYGEWSVTKEATCTEKGIREKECSACGDKVTEEIPALGHDWNTTDYEYDYDPDKCTIADLGDGFRHSVTGSITRRSHCNRCDEIKEESLENSTVKENHKYDEDSVCTACGYHKTPDALEEDNVRIFGKARYDTAIEVAEKYKGDSGKFKNVIVAYGQNFPDALSGGYLAKVKSAPILLVEPSEEARIVDYISKNIASGGKVYLLGGTGVVSSAFESAVRKSGTDTIRLGGTNRYETNLQILRAAGVKAEDIMICTGAGYADSLSASAVGKPILLVDNTLTDVQKDYIKGLSSKQFYLIGGTGAVKPAIEKDLKDLGLKTERLAGNTRYETSTAVAKEFFPKTKTVILAYAKNFPDGLSGGPLAMLENAPIVLTDSKTTAEAQAYVNSAGVVKSVTLGGPALISDIAVKAIMGR